MLSIIILINLPMQYYGIAPHSAKTDKPKKPSGVVNLTVASFCLQNNIIRPPATLQHRVGEAVTCVDARAASEVQRSHLSSLQLLIIFS